MSTTYATGINGNPIAASEVKPSSSLGTKLDGKASTSHTHSVIINGSTKEIAASGGTAVDLGTYLTSHQTIKQDGVTGATVNRFGTCSTAASTATKEVSITSGTFTLEAGATVAVSFSNKNTANSPTLKVGSTDAKNIFVRGTKITSGSNRDMLNGTVLFIYDGTQYHLIGNYYDSTYSGFVCGYCNTNAGTAAKEVFATNYYPSIGNVILVRFNSPNSAAGALTLKAGGVTAPIVWNGTLTASGSTSEIPAGTWPCTYDGTNWYVWTDGTYQFKENTLKVTSNGQSLVAATGTLTYSQIASKIACGITDIYVDLTFTVGNYQRYFIPLVTCTYPTNGNPLIFAAITNSSVIYISLDSNDTLSGNMYSLPLNLTGGTDITVYTDSNTGATTVAVDTTGSATGTNAFVEGYNTTASGTAAHAEGYRETANKSIASAKASHVEGIDTLASGVASHAEGFNTNASNKHAHAEGESTVASGEDAHAEGARSVASGNHAHAEGESYASGKNSHSEGFNLVAGTYGAQGVASHSEGSVTYAVGTSAHAEGGGTNALGKDSHAEGLSTTRPITTTLTEAHSANTSIFKISTSAGTISTSMYLLVRTGEETQFLSRVKSVSTSGSTITLTTDNALSTALSAGTTVYIVSSGSAMGMASHVEGFTTTAIKNYAHAEGFTTKAIGEASHAEGYFTVAGDDYMHVAGKCNLVTTGMARVTGWGTTSAPRDIERLDTDGNMWVNGHFMGATPFYVFPGTTTYAEIESAFNERRPLIMDVSYLNASANVVYVPASMRKVPIDANLEHFEYHFKFEYPFNYRAGYYAGSMESYVLYECYIAVNEQNGWLKLDLSDPNDLETRVWNTWGTSGNIAPVPVEYANRAVNAKYATNYLAGGNIASALSGKANSSHTHSTTDLTLTSGSSVVEDSTEFITTNVEGYDGSTDHDKAVYRRHAGNRVWPWVETKLETGSSKTIKSTINTGNFGFLAQHGTSGKWVGVGAKRTDTNVSVDIEVGGDGKRHGLWSSSLDDWLLVHSSDGLSSFWISGAPNRKAMVNAVATTLGYCATNEINFTHVPTSGNTNRTWFNYRNGDTWAADSSNTNDYYVFGNRNNKATTTLCATGIYPGEPGTTPSVKVKIMGGLTVTNLGQTAGAKLACGTIQTDSAIQKSTATYTVSKTDLSDGADGVLYIYINKYTDTQTATWKNWAGSNSSGPVYPGCAAMFICIKYSDGTFARIS